MPSTEGYCTQKGEEGGYGTFLLASEKEYVNSLKKQRLQLDGKLRKKFQKKRQKISLDRHLREAQRVWGRRFVEMADDGWDQHPAGARLIGAHLAREQRVGQGA